MQSLMDKVEHHTAASSNTVVRLVKFLPGHGERNSVESDHHASLRHSSDRDGKAPTGPSKTK